MRSDVKSSLVFFGIVVGSMALLAAGIWVGRVIGYDSGYEAGYNQCQTDIVSGALDLGKGLFNGIKSLTGGN